MAEAVPAGATDRLVAVGVGSAVVLGSTVDVEGSEFAVVVSIVSLLLVGAVLFIARTRPRLLLREVIWCHLQDPWPESWRCSLGSWKLVEAVAFGLAGWWVMGAGMLTFRGPFLTVGNGFFASWFSLYASIRLLASVCDKAPVTSCLAHISLDLDDAPLSGVLVAAVVLIFACIHLARNLSTTDDQHAAQQAVGANLGIGCGSFSLVVVTGLRASRVVHTRHDERSRSVALLRAICTTAVAAAWLVALAVLTFRESPFTPATGNGYFACWLGFFSAASLTLLETAAYAQHR